MNDLIEFLRARLDEDEQIARSAGGATWVVNMGDVVSTALAERDYGPDGIWVASASFSCEGDAEALHEGHAEHIARHDPARVLAEVDAKRRIIDLIVLNADGQPLYRDSGAEVWEDVLRLLALPFAVHPHFREEWRR